MNVSRCIKMAKVALQSYRSVTCEWCGAETLSGGGAAFCSNCELMVNTEPKAVENGNPALSASLAAIRSAVSKGDFPAASAEYERLIAERPGPQLLYAKGLMMLAYSNYTVSQIRYDGEGFMERNAQLRADASIRVSEAKRLIAKSLAVSEKEAVEASSAHAFYRAFLCDLKMNDLRAAADHLSRMEKLGKDSLVSQYARVALESYAGQYKEAERSLEAVFKLKSPPANAFYYAAFNAFKLGDLGGARRLLVDSGTLIEDGKRARLLEAIGR